MSGTTVDAELTQEQPIASVCIRCGQDITDEQWQGHECNEEATVTEQAVLEAEEEVAYGEPDVMQEQPPLLPETRPDMELRTIKLDDLPPSDDPIYAGRTVTADSKITRSIKRLGVHTPILLVEKHAGGYRLEAGRKRILAARLAGLDEIAANVKVANGWDVEGVYALSENEHRDMNLYGEVHAVVALFGRGYSAHDIAAELAIDTKRLQYLAKFIGLHPELLAAMANGKLKPTVAEAASKLTRDQQEQVVEALNAGERITGAFIHGLREAGRTASVQSLELGTEDMPETEEPFEAGLRSGISYLNFAKQAFRQAGDEAATDEQRAVTEELYALCRQAEDIALGTLKGNEPEESPF